MTRSPSGIAIQVTGEGTPVLMLMGFCMRGRVWRFQSDELAKHHTVATYDNRGLGDTAPPKKPFSMVDLAEDALEVADTLGWERFHAVGVSMGGMAAQELAIRHPDRVQTLSLLASQPGGPGAFIPPMRSLPRMLLVAAGGERFRAKLTHRVLHPPGSLARFTADQRAQRIDDAHGVRVPSRIRSWQLRAVARHDTRDRLSQIQAPTLVIQPVLDRLCRPSHSFTLVEGIPRARLLRLPTAGHGLVFHAADAVNAALLRHMAK